jgi:fluoride ion exporter CrcB/FEX
LCWLLGIRLNSLFPAILPGTLAANLIGGYLVGFGIASFASFDVCVNCDRCLDSWLIYAGRNPLCVKLFPECPPPR